MPRGLSLIARFRSDRSGAVALIFALSVISLFGIVGFAIDASRAYSLSSRLSAVLDSAALAAAKLLDHENATDAQVQERAIAMLNAHLGALHVPGVTLGTPNVIPDRANSAVEINVDIVMPTSFAQVIGVPSFSFNRSSKVAFQQQRIELALVLDVTGSMNSGGRLAAMKIAAKNVVDALIDPASAVQSRISLVPYSAAVNVGTYKDIASGGDSLDGCVMERLYEPSRDTDDVSGGTRNFAVNGQLNSDTNSRYACPPAVMAPLSNSPATLKDTIDSYGAAGWTAGHIGLAWGWNTISPNWASVFTGGSAPGPYGDSRYIKAILLMTDGNFNTSYTAGTTDAEQTSESTARTNALCSAIKARNVIVYAVAFQAPVEAENLLRNCATSVQHFYDANNSAQLIAAFKAITDDLQQLRIMR